VVTDTPESLGLDLDETERREFEVKQAIGYVWRLMNRAPGLPGFALFHAGVPEEYAVLGSEAGHEGEAIIQMWTDGVPEEYLTA
jgi:hypothetical protein